MRAPFLCLAAALFSAAALAPSAFAQDTARSGSARRAGHPRPPAGRCRQAGLRPGDEPGAWPARGRSADYTKGCVAGAVQLPADGPNWQVMRPSRNRAWGHPVLIAVFAAARRDTARRSGLAGAAGRRYRRSRAAGRC